jgi:hypothetical protein
MALDRANAWGLIQQQLHCNSSITECMRVVIEDWERRKPHSDWQKLRSLDFDCELSNLRDAWLAKVIREEPPINLGITGLWVGLFHPIRDALNPHKEMETVTDFYIAGSPAFELDTAANWASCPAYFPEGRYAESEVLSAIHRIMYEKSYLFGDAFEFLCPAYVAYTIKHLFKEVNGDLIVEPGKSVGVAIGWDAGDALYIGTLTSKGFHPRDVTDYVRSLRERHERFERRFNERYGKAN